MRRARIQLTAFLQISDRAFTTWNINDILRDFKLDQDGGTNDTGNTASTFRQ